MVINRAADAGVLVVVSVVGQGGVLFVEDQAGRQKLEVRNGADSCGMGATSSVSYVNAVSSRQIRMMSTIIPKSVILAVVVFAD